MPDRFDPRFDPAFQRGFEPTDDTATAPAAPPPSRRNVASPARYVPDLNPSGRPQEIGLPPREAAPSHPQREAAPSPAEPQPAPAPTPSHPGPEWNGAEPDPAPRRLNPFLVALLVVAAALIAGGLYLLTSMQELYSNSRGLSTFDYVSFQVALYAAPVIICLGAATAIGVLFVYAIRWGRAGR